MYDQVQGDSMKNKLLFMMLTILGAPGIATATNYDLARSEYNFAVNELSKSSFNQAAIIGQVGTDNSARVRQEGSKLLSVISQEGGNNRAKVDQAGNYNFAYIEQTGKAMPTMPVYRKALTVIVRLLSRKVLEIRPILPSTVRRKQQL